MWVVGMMRQKTARREILPSEPASPAAKEAYLKKWDLLKEKSAKGCSNASVDGMTVYRNYNPQRKVPESEIGHVIRRISLLHPGKLMENNKRVSLEDMEEALRLTTSAQNDPACIVIFREDGLFVIARKSSNFAGNK